LFWSICPAAGVNPSNLLNNGKEAMKNIAVSGVGNALTDLLLDVSEDDFNQLNLERASMRLVDQDTQRALLQRVECLQALELVSGGSVANSIIALAQLGAKTGYQCLLGDDRYGANYIREFKDLGIELKARQLPGQASGTSLVLITPDAERTMRTCLGASALFSEKDLDCDLIRDSDWLLVEGYVLTNSAQSCQAVLKAVRMAKECQTKVAYAFSDAIVAKLCADAVRQIMSQADLICLNDTEACAYTAEKVAEGAFDKLLTVCPQVVMTMGAKGAMVCYGGERGVAVAVNCKPRDLTGAGDMFAGSFLYGISSGLPALRAAKAANYMAAQVITKVGARLTGDAKALWQQALAAK
jgi:sugar/nucleoside kinase (ribokinase family)